jgi:hypothetical protein
MARREDGLFIRCGCGTPPSVEPCLELVGWLLRTTLDFDVFKRRFAQRTY